MRTLAWSTLQEYADSHADAETALRAWYQVCKRASWDGTQDMLKDFPSADMVGEKAVFNIKGNAYRLVAVVNFQSKHVLVKWVGTHAEYDNLRVENL